MCTFKHGLSPVARDAGRLFSSSIRTPKPLALEDINKPDSPIVRKADEYLKTQLSAEIWNHSQRVFYIGANAT
jgi:hypothetical protein